MRLAFTADQNGHFYVPQFKDPAAAKVNYGVEYKTKLVSDSWMPLYVNGMFTNDIGSAEMEEVQYRFWAGSGAPQQRYIRLIVERTL